MSDDLNILKYDAIALGIEGEVKKMCRETSPSGARGLVAGIRRALEYCFLSRLLNTQ